MEVVVSTTGSLPASNGYGELVADFLAGKNENTLRAYNRDLLDFAAFLEVPGIPEAARILLNNGAGNGNALVLRYRNHLAERRLSPATINRRISALRSLVTLGQTTGVVAWSLTVKGIPSKPYRDTRGTGRSGYRLLLEVTRQDARPMDVRNRAIIRLLYDLALRRGEVARLDYEDLDLKRGAVSVLRKKRKEKVLLTLPAETAKALREWIEHRGTEPGALFTNFDPTGKGERLTGTSIYRIVRALGETVNIKARPHGLRHAAITEALDITNGNVRAVRRFSGHSKIETLMVYDDNREDVGGEIARRLAAETSLR